MTELFYSYLLSVVILEVQCCFSEANPVIAHVELGVVRSNKDISQNPERPRRRRRHLET